MSVNTEMNGYAKQIILLTFIQMYMQVYKLLFFHKYKRSYTMYNQNNVHKKSKIWVRFTLGRIKMKQSVCYKYDIDTSLIVILHKFYT